MARVFQVRWSDEDIWHDVRELSKDELDKEVLDKAVASWRESKKRYPHHKFFPRLRIIKR